MRFLFAILILFLIGVNADVLLNGGLSFVSTDCKFSDSKASTYLACAQAGYSCQSGSAMGTSASNCTPNQSGCADIIITGTTAIFGAAVTYPYTGTASESNNQLILSFATPTAPETCKLTFNEVSSSSKKCFPASAKVQLENGVVTTMNKLAIGDKVLVAPNLYSDIYMFSHQYDSTVNEFYTIRTNSSVISLTGEHYLYANSNLVIAQEVKEGDVLIDENGIASVVQSIIRETKKGLYNPHTLHGDIVVDGIITSTYTQAVKPSVAHALLAPVRMLYNAGIEITGNAFENGNDAIVTMLPKGKTVEAL